MCPRMSERTSERVNFRFDVYLPLLSFQFAFTICRANILWIYYTMASNCYFIICFRRIKHRYPHKPILATLSMGRNENRKIVQHQSYKSVCLLAMKANIKKPDFIFLGFEH